MKWSIVLAVLMTCMVVGHCKSCQKSEDCNDGECCVASTLNQIRGNGTCRRLGRLGSPCNLEDVTLESYGGKYLTKCPCRSDFSCEKSPRYRDGTRSARYRLLADLSQRCRRPSTTTTKDNVVTTSTETTGVSIDSKTVSVTSVTNDGTSTGTSISDITDISSTGSSSTVTATTT